MSAIPKVLVPLAIDASMVTACSVTEPSATETAWVSGGTYALGDRRIRSTTHRNYECVLAHTGISTFPENDPNRWQDIGPTDFWAQFDTSTSTQTLSTSPYTVTIQPGFFNAIGLYKAKGSTATITVKDAPGGTTVLTYTTALDGPYLDEWDYCWGPYRQNGKVLVSGIAPYPSAEITITITASSGQAGVGMIVIGDLRDLLIGVSGGTEYGATAEPVDYSYINTNEFGETNIVKRHSATDMRIRAFLEQSDADYALQSLQEVLATPAAWIATDEAGYAGLNVFGLGAGRVIYEGPNHAALEINVKGLL